MSRPPITIRQAMTDRHLFGQQFGGDSWAAWRSLLAGFYALELDETEAAHWRTLTEREPPTSPHEELWIAAGRRSGKSQIGALLTVYEAAFRDHRPNLAAGECATSLVLAADKKQARTTLRYIRGLFQSNEMLGRMVVRETNEGLELNNRSVIEVLSSNFRSVRGYSLASVVNDELAFWLGSDTSNPDNEVIAALRPALATLGGKLIAISSPYARKGTLWDNYRRHYGVDDSPVLVAQAESRTLNSSLPQRVVDEAMERDPASASSEYLGQFRQDVEAFVSLDAVEACMRPSPPELPYVPRNRYFAFVDPSGGSGSDSMAVAIGHTEGDTVVVDLVREHKPPFQPDAATSDIAGLLKSYAVRHVTGDLYGGQWPAERFAAHGINYVAASRAKSDLYGDLLPAINAGRVELPPGDRLKSQLVGLERRSLRSGKQRIDHAPHGSDDLSNVIAGAVVESAANRKKPARIVY